MIFSMMFTYDQSLLSSVPKTLNSNSSFVIGDVTRCAMRPTRLSFLKKFALMTKSSVSVSRSHVPPPVHAEDIAFDHQIVRAQDAVLDAEVHGTRRLIHERGNAGNVARKLIGESRENGHAADQAVANGQVAFAGECGDRPVAGTAQKEPC